MQFVGVCFFACALHTTWTVPLYAPVYLLNNQYQVGGGGTQGPPLNRIVVLASNRLRLAVTDGGGARPLSKKKEIPVP